MLKDSHSKNGWRHCKLTYQEFISSSHPGIWDNDDDVLDSLLQSVGPVNAHGLITRQVVSSLITKI